MLDSRWFLAAYDQQLRTDAETPSAIAVARLGPLRLVSFDGGRGFVTYQSLGGADAKVIADWVPQVIAHYRQDPDIRRIEWKTRGHDHSPGLHEALVSHGFKPDEAESIMIGQARLLDVEVHLPEVVKLRRIAEEADVRAMSAMQDEMFGDPVSDEMADALLRRLALDDGMELWSLRSRARSSALVVSNRSRGPNSPGSGAARRDRSGAARGYIGPSWQREPGQPSPQGRH